MHRQTLHIRPGETITLGLLEASVYYDDAGGAFRLVATLTEGPGSTPIHLSTNLQLGQGLTISVPGLADKPATAVRLMHTQDGLDVSYASPAID